MGSVYADRRHLRPHQSSRAPCSTLRIRCVQPDAAGMCYPLFWLRSLDVLPSVIEGDMFDDVRASQRSAVETFHFR